MMLMKKRRGKSDVIKERKMETQRERQRESRKRDREREREGRETERDGREGDFTDMTIGD